MVDPPILKSILRERIIRRKWREKNRSLLSGDLLDPLFIEIEGRVS